MVQGKTSLPEHRQHNLKSNKFESFVDNWILSVSWTGDNKSLTFALFQKNAVSLHASHTSPKVKDGWGTKTEWVS